MLLGGVAAAAVHPSVTGKANVINLESSGLDFYGKLFIGSEYRETKMIYDTASDMVTVNTEQVFTAKVISNYDLEESSTAKPLYADADKE